RCAYSHRSGGVYAGFFRVSQSLHGRELATALADGAVKQALGQGAGHKSIHRPRSRRFAKNGHASRVAAKGSDVLPDPFEGGYLIHNPVIAGGVMCAFRSQGRMGKEPKGAQPVIDSHDDRAFAGEVLAVIGGKTAGAAGKASAVNPHHDGKLV